MKCLTVGVLVALSLAACTSGSSGDASRSEGEPSLTEPSPVAGPSLSVSERRTALVYQAIIAKLYRHGRGRPIFVLTRTRSDAGRPRRGRSPDKGFIDRDIQRAIAEGPDSTPMRFVSRGASVMKRVQEGACQVVKHGGALVRLSAIKLTSPGRAEVGVGSFSACLAGSWATYVVQRRNDEWRVTGTTGPVAIS